MTSPPDRLLHHRTEGPAAAPPLLLGPSLGTSTGLWDAVAPDLSTAHRVVRWDLPGHGGSAADLIGPGATVADLAALVMELADSLSLDRFSYAGVSLGGAVGLWLAVHHPERIDRLALVCSSAHFGEPGPWQERAALVRRDGLAPVAAGAAARWFTPGFTAPELLDDLRATDPSSYAACCDALAAYDLRLRLSEIRAATLVIAGREDPATPPHTPGSSPTLSPTPRSPSLRRPRIWRPPRIPRRYGWHCAATSVRTGTATVAWRCGERYSAMRMWTGHRPATTGFTARFQDFITRYAWGEIWTDPTLSRRERSLITLTALVAHGHHDELAMHVRAALRNGLTPEEIGAALLQTGVYCGVPAANSAFAVARRVLEEIQETDGPDASLPN